MKKQGLCTALGLILGISSAVSHAATINVGDTVTIASGTPITNTSGAQVDVSGSYFGINDLGSSTILGTDKDPVAQGTTGLTIGAITAPGAIDGYTFLGASGSDSLTIAASGSTSSGTSAGGLNLSGWTMNWNGQTISLSSGAWQPVNCSALGCTGHTFTNGNAEFTWDGIYGDTYSLNYTATFPASSVFATYQYYLHLQGLVEAAPAPVPLPGTVWLLSTGLLGILGFAIRRRDSNYLSH